jgi:hypothetical protein
MGGPGAAPSGLLARGEGRDRSEPVGAMTRGAVSGAGFRVSEGKR